MNNTGSSPLSRGIHSNPALSNLKVRDHPRSRGEYVRVIERDGEPWGSSPLSRGIHPDERVGMDPLGIIPALAGNTGPDRLAQPVPPDHPRSRGEYAIVLGPATFEKGSSPLSRGIPSCGTNAHP